MVDWNIAAQGNRTNFGASIDQGMQAYQQGQQTQQQNALQAYLQQNAKAIMAGDQNALAGLAQFDPQVAMAIAGDQQAMQLRSKADRRAGVESQTNIADSKERLKLAQAQAKAEMDEHAVKMSAAQRAEAADRIEAIAADATQIETPKEWDEHFGGMGPEFAELVGNFDQKKFYEAKALGTIESLKAQAPQAPQSPQGKLQADIDAGLAPANAADPKLAPQSPQGKINEDMKNGFIDPSARPGYDAKGETALRREFNSLQPVKEFQAQSTAMSRIAESGKDPSAAGDMALLFGYMKLLDPTSTVREGEYATAAQAGSVPERIVAQYNKVKAGETLSQDMRNDFLDRANKLYSGAKEQFEHVAGQYKQIAKSRHLRPNRAVPNYDAQGLEAAAPPAGRTTSTGVQWDFGGPQQMASIIVNGRHVTVSDNFMSLSPEDQDATVDEIAQSMGEPQQSSAQPPEAAPPIDGGSALGAGIAGFAQGATLNTADEIKAGGWALIDKMNAGLSPNAPSLGEAYDKRLAETRGDLAARTEAHKGAALTGNLTGAAALSSLVPGATSTVLGAAATGGVVGALAGAGGAEGGPVQRATGAVAGGALGSLFGAGAHTAWTIGTKATRALMGKAAVRPTLDTFKAATQRAYKAVDDAGEVFQPAELQGMAQGVEGALKASNTYHPAADVQTAASLDTLKGIAQQPMKLGQLDSIRKSLWKRYNRSGEVGILDAIDGIDDLVQTRAGTSELMDAARAASKKQKKAEILENAFKKAEDQTKSTGSGGNILNKYKQAITKIVNNPKVVKYFDEDEVALMQKVIDGPVGEETLRRIGKLSPSGNGLMLFLNVLGASHGGVGFLPVTAAGVGAKYLADSSGRAGVDALLNHVAGVPAPAAIRSPNALAGMAGYSSGSLLNR